MKKKGLFFLLSPHLALTTLCEAEGNFEGYCDAAEASTQLCFERQHSNVNEHAATFEALPMKLCYRVVVFVFFVFPQRFSFRPFAKAAPRAAHFLFRYAPSEGCLSCTADLLLYTPASHWPADNPRHTTETTQDETGFAIVVNAKSSRLWL